MEFDRNDRARTLIAELTAQFIRQEASSDPLITVTRVDLSKDSKQALILFTTIPEEKEEQALVFLKRKAGEVRTFLKKESRLRAIPHLEFMIDFGERNRQRIDTIVTDVGI